MTVVPLSRVLHRAFVVPDMHAASKIHGISHRMNSPAETEENRVHARFFVIPV